MDYTPRHKRCGKVCYTSRKEAKEIIKRVNHRGKFKVTNAYFCDQCDHWHVTSMEKDKSREIGRKKA
jgi:hypothetical protein